MNVLIIGAGGIGSYLIEYITEFMIKGLIRFSNVNITVTDFDKVEFKNLDYQNFKIEDVGKHKVVALNRRFGGFVPLKKRINSDKNLEGYDLILLCVDNDVVRNMVYEYCYKYSKEFIDIRSEGKKVFCLPKGVKILEDLKFIDLKDTNSYSCQEKKDLDSGQIQFTNRVAASIGFQMFLNHLRKVPNHKINFMI